MLILALLVSACSTLPTAQRPPALQPCLTLYDDLDQATAETGYSPTAWARITGFPYLRVDRFLASYRQESLSLPALHIWLARMAALDQQARAIELARLPATVHATLQHRHGTTPLPRQLATCAERLLAHDLTQPAQLASLREHASVPADYSTFRRSVGLYPLTALPVRLGIARWHADTQTLFAKPLNALPVTGHLQRFRPAEQPPSALPVLRHDALGVPQLTTAQEAVLFQQHAPVFEIDVSGHYDLPGQPVWQRDGLPTVNTTTPVVYRYLTYTRWQQHVLLQLNYLIWFAERPLLAPSDLYGGPLDGLLWRVTLTADGTPLLYDSIHACGCYHLFFPQPKLHLRSSAQNLPEPPLVPQTAPPLAAQQRIIIRLAAQTHFIQRVYADGSAHGIPYAWQDYANLYQTPLHGDGTRSLFNADSLVTGTDRHERWLLWPMGIASAGAMRERGHHATAFVGQRHFDDADLVDSLFMTHSSLDRPDFTQQ